MRLKIQLFLYTSAIGVVFIILNIMIVQDNIYESTTFLTSRSESHHHLLHQRLENTSTKNVIYSFGNQIIKFLEARKEIDGLKNVLIRKNPEETDQSTANRVTTERLTNKNEPVQHRADDPLKSTAARFADVVKLVPSSTKFKKKNIKLRLLSLKNYRAPMALMRRAKLMGNDTDLQNFLGEQIRRGKRIKKICIQSEKRLYNKTNDNGAPIIAISSLKNIIIDRLNFITFCPIYKAASTSWSINLLILQGLWKETRSELLQKLLSQAFITVPNYIAPMSSASTTRFIIVRHPFERLISCYRDKFELGKNSYYYSSHGEKMMLNYRPRPPEVTSEEVKVMLSEVKQHMTNGTSLKLLNNLYANPVGPTVEEFIKYVLYSKVDEEHWRPYYDHCSVCQMRYNFILRFDHLRQEENAFIEYLNQSSTITSRWDNPTSEGATTEEVACSYFKQLNAKTVELLIGKYALDFDLFEYDPDPYLKCSDSNESGVPSSGNR